VIGAFTLLRPKATFEDVTFKTVLPLNEQRHAPQDRLHDPPEPGRSLEQHDMNVIVHHRDGNQSRAG
jgi:hypothetical protein